MQAANGTPRRDVDEAVAVLNARRKIERVVLAAGNQMNDQFEPWYFGVAFVFCFKYCIGTLVQYSKV